MTTAGENSTPIPETAAPEAGTAGPASLPLSPVDPVAELAVALATGEDAAAAALAHLAQTAGSGDPVRFFQILQQELAQGHSLAEAVQTAQAVAARPPLPVAVAVAGPGAAVLETLAAGGAPVERMAADLFRSGLDPDVLVETLAHGETFTIARRAAAEVHQAQTALTVRQQISLSPEAQLAATLAGGGDDAQAALGHAGLSSEALQALAQSLGQGGSLASAVTAAATVTAAQTALQAAQTVSLSPADHLAAMLAGGGDLAASGLSVAAQKALAAALAGGASADAALEAGETSAATETTLVGQQAVELSLADRLLASLASGASPCQEAALPKGACEAFVAALAQGGSAQSAMAAAEQAGQTAVAVAQEQAVPMSAEDQAAAALASGDAAAAAGMGEGAAAFVQALADGASAAAAGADAIQASATATQVMVAAASPAGTPFADAAPAASAPVIDPPAVTAVQVASSVPAGPGASLSDAAPAAAIPFQALFAAVSAASAAVAAPARAASMAAVSSAAAGSAGAVSQSATSQSAASSSSGSATAAVTTPSTAPAVSTPTPSPVNSMPGPVTVNPTGGVLLSGLGVADADSQSGPIQVTLTVGKGTLTLEQTAGLAFISGDGVADASLSFSGSLAAVNAALARVFYQPDPAARGTDALTLTSQVLGGTGAGGALRDSDAILITLTTPNTPPVLTVPDRQSGQQDTPLPLSGLRFSDSDSGTPLFQMTLAVEHGVLSLGQSQGLTFSSGDGTADSVLRFQGHKDAINAALATLIYQPETGYAGSDAVSVRLGDPGASDQGSPLEVEARIALDLRDVNDPPALFTPGAQTLEPDNSLNLAGIRFSDPDSGTTPFQLSLAVEHGALSLGTVSGLTFAAGDGDRDGALIATGSQTALNAALAALSYQPAAGYVGADHLALTLTDPGTGGPVLSVAGDVPLTIRAAPQPSQPPLPPPTPLPLPPNQSPVNTVPIAQTVLENTNLILNGFAIADKDAGGGTFRVTLQAGKGTVSLGTTENLGFLTGDGVADPLIRFYGTLAAVNTAIATVTYRPNPDYFGSDTLTLTSDDQGNFGSGGSGIDTDAVAITVTHTNLAPVNTVPGSQSIADATDLALSGILVADSDLSAGTGTGSLKVTLAAAHGALSLTGVGESLTFSDGDGTADSTMTFSGSLAAVNAALGTLTYRSALYYDGSDAISLLSHDLGNYGLGGAKTDLDTIPVTVIHTNLPPVNTVPAGKSVNDNTDLILGGTVVSDPDLSVGSGIVKMTVSAAHGVVSLASVAGLTFSSGDGTADGAMTFSGSLAAVNTALATLTYRSALYYNGSDAITITSNDNGNSGTGGARTDTDAIPLTVTHANLAPVNTVPGGQTALQATNLTLNGLAVADADLNGNPLQATLTAGHGVISLATTTGLTFSSGDGAADSVMTFSGALSAVNAALNGIVYRSDAGYSGADTITLTSNDLGSSGAGGARTDTDAIALTVLSNAPPVLVTNAGLSFNRGAQGVIGNSLLKTTDANNSSNQITYTLSALPDSPATLLKNGVALGVGGTFTQSDIDNALVQVSVPFSSTVTATSFTASISDGEGGFAGPFTFPLAIKDGPAAVLISPNPEGAGFGGGYAVAGGHALVTGLGGGAGLGEITLAQDGSAGTSLTAGSLDDGYWQVDLSATDSAIKLGANTYSMGSQIYCSTNGYITFGVGDAGYNAVGGMSLYKASPIIAAQYNDVDLRYAGSGLFVDAGNDTVTVTWRNVSPYNATTPLNSYQIRLHALENSDYAYEIRYDGVTWGSLGGWSLGNPASGAYGHVVGVNNGTYTQNASGNSAYSNIGHSGVYVWESVDGAFAGGVRVKENTPAGTTIGYLSTTDSSSNDSFTYTLLNSSGGQFVLANGNELQTTATPLDYETKTSHTIQVQVTDSTGNTLVQDLTVRVTDVPAAKRGARHREEPSDGASEAVLEVAPDPVPDAGLEILPALRFENLADTDTSALLAAGDVYRQWLQGDAADVTAFGPVSDLDLENALPDPDPLLAAWTGAQMPVAGMAAARVEAASGWAPALPGWLGDGDGDVATAGNPFPDLPSVPGPFAAAGESFFPPPPVFAEDSAAAAWLPDDGAAVHPFFA